ncbi:SOS response-associated peptidase [Xanthovirga aplysinae]|uniref:SOS response-associated peptidase n=1 Tax=Xanthovirga aplysinae TaxID=2529853 RepID=UPI001656FBF8|nr:SOS response-associated peptidase [Xanthovirga aplysinae]
MCDRYAIYSSAEELQSRFQLETHPIVPPRYNAAPSQALPVITHESPHSLSFFFWGLDPYLAKGKIISQKAFNAESEKVTKSPLYRLALPSRRCLIPANGFYLWKKVSKKGQIPYYCHLSNKSVFAMGGLWDEYENPENNKKINTFTLITIPSNQSLFPLQNRIPLIFTREMEEQWLHSKDINELKNMLMQPIMAETYHYSVSNMVNKFSIDHEDLILPVKPADQYGNYNLFDWKDIK